MTGGFEKRAPIVLQYFHRPAQATWVALGKRLSDANGFCPQSARLMYRNAINPMVAPGKNPV
jgi:hypothetical protein